MLYTNLFTNPRPGASSGGWGAGGGLGGTSASSTIAGAGGPAGDSARRVSWSVGPTNFGGLIFAANATAPVAVTAGTVCSAAGWTRPSKNQQFTARVTFFTDSTYTTTVSVVDSSPIFAPANVWTEIKIENLTVPATANNARFAVAQHASGTLWAAGDTHDVQAATIIVGPSLPQPFHGGLTSDATYTYAWSGTADASTSTLLGPSVVAGATANATAAASAGAVPLPIVVIGTRVGATAAANAGAATAGATVSGVTATAGALATSGATIAGAIILGSPVSATSAASAGALSLPIVISGIAARATSAASAGALSLPIVISGIAARATSAASAGTAVAAATAAGTPAASTSVASAGTLVAGAVPTGATATSTSTASAGTASAGSTTPGATASATSMATSGSVGAASTISGITAPVSAVARGGFVPGASSIITGTSAIAIARPRAGTVTAGNTLVGPTTYKNLFPNPRPNPASSSGWGKADGLGGTATASMISGSGGPGGDSARRVTVNTAPTNMGVNIFVGNPAGIIPVIAGNNYSSTVWARCSKSQLVQLRLTYFSDTAYGTQISQIEGPIVSLLADTWTEVKFEGDTAPPTSVAARVVLIGAATGTLWVAGDTFDAQAATVVEGLTVPQPFHGGMTSDSTHTYAWTGTADASTSTLVASNTAAGAAGNATAPAGTVGIGATVIGTTARAYAAPTAGAVPVLDWFDSDPWFDQDPLPGPHTVATLGPTARVTASARAGTPTVRVTGVTATTASATARVGRLPATVVGSTAIATARAFAGAVPIGTAATVVGSTATAIATPAATIPDAPSVVAATINGVTAKATAAARAGTSFMSIMVIGATARAGESTPIGVVSAAQRIAGTTARATAATRSGSIKVIVFGVPAKAYGDTGRTSPAIPTTVEVWDGTRWLVVQPEVWAGRATGWIPAPTAAAVP